MAGRARTERGQMAVLSFMAIVVIAVLGGSLLNRGLDAHRETRIQQADTDLLYAAEGAIEDAIAQFSTAIANFTLDANAPRFPVAAGTFLNTAFASGAAATAWVDEAEPAPRTVADPDGVPLFVKNYHITAQVTHPATARTLTVHQVIERRIIYTFQHAVFYDEDLEWLPGPDMTLSGRVHSNSDIYLGANAILTVDSEYLRAAGNLYNRRKDDGTVPGGVVQIKKAGSSPAQFPAMSGLDSDDATWPVDSQTRWNGTVKTGVHGVTQRAVPVIGSITPGGFYDSQAGVRIDGTTLTKDGTVLVEGNQASGVPPGTVTSSSTLYNNREGKYVTMTNVNLRKLAGWYDCNGDSTDEQCYPNNLPANGLIYATRTANLSQQPGIRLLKGSEIKRAGGLTVVSNLPVYVQGDFNTVSKKPVSVIADALNLLSNNWNDSNSTQSLSTRSATATTVNAAFIAGVNPTTPGRYNGGLENYPRLHEGWSGVDLRITGSFVALWASQVATGAWQYGTPQYTAPRRLWAYESSFSSGANLPPFTPWAVEIAKGAWWKE